jgi:uncharacterized membrane protein YfcA
VTKYRGAVKEFVVYTLLRAVLLVATFGIVAGAWLLIAGHANILISIVIAFVVSGIGSYFLLQSPRNKFAQMVEARAEKATAAFDAMRAKEDADRATDPSSDSGQAQDTNAGG